uniref:Uncharacterized protein n=1 Tax=Anopheles atroparvus TaxID=41427 RepID=A0A182IN76_ANOAO
MVCARVTIGAFLLALTAGTIVGRSAEPRKQPEQLFAERLGPAERMQYFGGERESGWPYFELVDVDVRRPHDGDGDVQDLNLSFSFRDEPIVFRLKPNRVLTNTPVTVLTTAQERVTKRFDADGRAGDLVAHYVHNDGNTTAALSSNGDDKFSGIILHNSGPLEIMPLDPGVLDLQPISVFRRPHLIKKLNVQSSSDVTYELVRRRTHSEIHLLGDTLGQKNYSSTELEELDARDARNRSAPSRYGRPVLELAVFFDEAAYSTFAPYLDHSDAALRDFLLAYINGIQALYHHPSLGQGVDVSLVYLELMRNQPPEMPHYGGERNLLLDSFCAYQSALNQGRWDMGLYLSGLDFYFVDNGRRSGGTMGLATVGGVCLSDYACVIAEFGARNVFGKPYPSSGFTSVFIAAHEIGHKDKDAILASTGQPDICQNLRCRTPHRTGFYFAGPALEGTDCGDSKWCHGGKCVKQKKKPTNATPGGWSEWMDGDCISGCLEQSRGYQRRTRRCDNPPPVNTDQGCEGVALDVAVCDDQPLCRSNREPVQFYASRRCKEFSQLLPRLDPAGRGIQGPYDSKRLWMSCAIYCKRADSDAYYAPRFDLNDLGVDSYFPDGTLCHQESGTNYYCQQHHCLPENFKTSKISIWSITEDIPVAGNAIPMSSHFLDSAILNYLSLDRNITPLTSTWALKPDQLPNDDQWVDQDYLDLTGNFKTSGMDGTQENPPDEAPVAG